MQEFRTLHFIFYVIVFVIGWIQTLIFMMINMMLIGLITYCISLFQHLKYEIEDFGGSYARFKISEERCQNFKKLVRIHSEYLDFATKLNDFVSLFLLIYYVTFIILACLLCNHIRTVSYCILCRFLLISIFFAVLQSTFGAINRLSICFGHGTSPHTSFILRYQAIR